jgi:hypothetical protein
LSLLILLWNVKFDWVTGTLSDFNWPVSNCYECELTIVEGWFTVFNNWCLAIGETTVVCFHVLRSTTLVPNLRDAFSEFQKGKACSQLIHG